MRDITARMERRSVGRWVCPTMSQILVVGLCLLLVTNGASQGRLSTRFNGQVSLTVEGDIPEFGFGYSELRIGWAACGGRGSCLLDYPFTRIGFVARGGAAGGFSLSSHIDLRLLQDFVFDYNPPSLSIPGYTYSYKTKFGFLYYALPLSVGSGDLFTFAGCGPNNYPPPDCCSSAYGELSFGVHVSTAGKEAAIEGGPLISSCTAGENCAYSGEYVEWPTPYDIVQTWKPQSIDFGPHAGSVTHREEVAVNINLNAFGTMCGAGGGGGTVGGGADTGLVWLSAPHPLGAPAIGENEYVWSTGRPTQLTIPARAYAYMQGWDPPVDLNPIAEHTRFRVDPPIQSERTVPGEYTIARGGELIAQTTDQYGPRDDLIFVRTELPPSNEDFGRKKVLFEVDGETVDYAEIEVFFPPTDTNHPADGPDGPNWFYYYWQAYGRPERVYYVNDEVEFYDPDNDEIYIGNRASPVGGHREVALYRLVTREDSDGRRRKLITFVDFLEVYGIHRFIASLEHEKSHRKYYTQGISRLDWDYYIDPDGDSLPSWWERLHGLDPDDHNTTGTPGLDVDRDGDSDAVAEIEAYGALLRAKDYWKKDWAQEGLQWGTPISPFPWRYHSTGTNQPRYRDLLTRVPRTRGR